MILVLLCTVGQGGWAQSSSSVSYYERSWNADSKTVVKTLRTLNADQYTELTGGVDISLQPGYYVVKANAGYNSIKMIGKGEHHLVLCDGATLNTTLYIEVEGENSLHIYGQEAETGKLKITPGFYTDPEYHAAIGGSNNASNGPIFIHGGTIDVGVRYRAAGIGGGSEGRGGIITIYGGTVKAQGGNRVGNQDYGAAGIGNGKGRSSGTITIYGGDVEARGGVPGGAGIGGGSHAGSSNFTITIHGGTVKAQGSSDAAGIGSGSNTSGGTVTIHGGTVEAHGGKYGAGIGCGMEALLSSDRHGGTIIITGGTVKAYGGVDAAGIGGGEDADGGTVTISGGYVYAEGKDDGAGIGGGQSGDGGKVTITGGTVEAKAGAQEGPDKGYRAIGAGHGVIGNGSDNNGSLTLGDDRLVTPYIGNTSQGYYPSGQRVNGCQRYPAVMIQQCHHPGADVTIIDGSSHNAGCTRCKMTIEQHAFGADGQCNVCKLIRLEDGGDNSAVFSAWTDDQPHTFVLSGRKLAAAQDEAGNWSNRAYTICVPFDMDLVPYMDSLTLYTLSYIRDGKEMVFTENLPYLFAGKPYLIVMRQGELELLSHDVMLTDTPSEEQVLDWNDHDREMGWWRGTLTKIDNAEATWQMAYALQSEGDFRRITTDSPEAMWEGFRAMYCPNELPMEADGVTQVNKLLIMKGVLFPNGDIDDYVTNFDPTLFMGDADIPDSTTAIKTMSDGRSKMEDGRSKMEDVWHTIDGRKFQGKPTQKGVYINKGRKVVIK